MSMNMTDINGTLQRQGSGQWGIEAPGREPVNIAVGDIFLLQDERRLMRRVRMEHADGKWHAVVSHRQPERRVELRNGLRAGFFDQRERYAKVLGP
jgi:hypothetical protein